MSTIRATFVQHGSSAVPNITLNASGQVIVASGIVSSGTFAAPSGSVSAPGIYFNGDSNTGLYSPAADTIAFTEGGVEALRIDSSGRVGIGTSSASARLHLNASDGNQLLVRSTSTSNITGAQTPYMQIDSSGGYTGSGSVTGLLVDISADSTTNKYAAIFNGGRVGIGITSVNSTRQVEILQPSGYTSGLRIRTDGSGAYSEYFSGASNWIIGSPHNTNALVFIGDATERARIDSSGRLLVGTSSTSGNVAGNDKLAVVITGDNTQGGISVTDYAGTSSTIGSYAALRLQRSLGTTDGSFTALTGSAWGLGRIEFNGSNGVGFGTGATIEGVVDALAWGNGDHPARLVFSTTADGASSPTERMRIDSSGNVGVGAASSGQKFFVENSGTARTASFHSTNASYGELILFSQSSRSASTAFSYFFAYNNSSVDTEFILRGDGNGLCDGSWTGGGADYAEYFEWEDGNPDAEDRRGYPVALIGSKIKIAEDGDAIIGIVSAAPVVLGDAAWNHWSGKFLKDDFGSYIMEPHQVVEWTDADGKFHSYEDWNLPDGVIIPVDATWKSVDENGKPFEHRKLNPDYDPTQPYVPREDRPEWSPIGLMGKLRLRKGQPVAPNWLKLRDISANVEEWLVR